MIKNIFFGLFIAIILALSIRGLPGNATAEQLNTPKWTQTGPFELSPERGRYALAYSLAIANSPFFSVPIARFAIPDLGYLHDRYVSMFAPGVSYLVLPGFWLGQMLGSAQVGAFAVVAIFALLNAFLIRAICRQLGINPMAASLAGLVFLFATPAFAYAVTLYQHHISTFLILASLYLLIRWQGSWTLYLVWFLCAASIPIDYPNLFLMAPIGILAAGRIIRPSIEKQALKFSLSPLRLFSLVGVVLPLAFFLWFNYTSYGNPLQFSGTVPTAREIDANGKPAIPKDRASAANTDIFLHPELQEKSAFRFFQSRNLLNGLNIHFISPDRSVLFFTPVILLSLVGMAVSVKKQIPYFPVFLGVILADITLYSLWGDPWGGWAFGSRYLIPGYAIASIFIGIALHYYSKKILFLALFLALSVYSVSVNTLGALTSNSNPPQVQILELERQSGRVQKYTFARNWDYLQSNSSKSFVFNALAAKQLSAVQYFYAISSIICIAFIGLAAKLYASKKYV